MTTTPATLMVVDDDSEIRELLADYLGRHGYHVLTADGADSLYQQLVDQAPDLLIVDVMMPGMTVLPSARSCAKPAIRRLLCSPPVPMIPTAFWGLS